MNKKFKLIAIFLDYFSAFVAWILFFIYRSFFLGNYDIATIFHDINLIYGIAFVPLFWIVLYGFFGYYYDYLYKPRLKVLFYTFIQSVFGVAILFFVLLIDDKIAFYFQYYHLFFTLIIANFFITVFLRLLFYKYISYLVNKKFLGFNTLVIGNNKKTYQIIYELGFSNIVSPHIIKGYVLKSSDDIPNRDIQKWVPCLGSIDNISSIIKSESIQEVIIASNEKSFIKKMVLKLVDFDVRIKTLPHDEDFFTGVIKTTDIYELPLYSIRFDIMPAWQKHIKFLMDKCLSLMFILLFSPFYIMLALAVKLSSEGSVFFFQERIGLKNKPFKIIKFRSMYLNSEQNGPRLSSEDDDRITKLGKFLRKTRLDETPQFFNVLIGHMSLVGPRPERRFFINQIIDKAPEYKILKKIKPGITSWGQVKYGYAENVDQMLRRLKYDLLYISNRSLYLDMKILIYTLIIVFKRQGK